MSGRPFFAPPILLAGLLWILSCGTSANGPDGNQSATAQSRQTNHTAPSLSDPRREGISSRTSSAEPKQVSSKDVSPNLNTVDDICPLLMRPGCAPRHKYGGVFDHFVDVECSTLFEIRRELPLSGTPRRLARGVVLIEKPARKAFGVSKLFTFDYTADTSREEKLVLKPAPTEIRAVLYDDEAPAILGRTGSPGKRGLYWSLWRLRCKGTCSMTGHLRFQSVDELDKAPDLLPAMRAEIAFTVAAFRRGEQRERCMRSSAGCPRESDEAILSDTAASMAGAEPDTAGTLPDNRDIRIALKNGDNGLSLIRTKNNQEIDRRLLISKERNQPMGAVGLFDPQPTGSGYVALLQALKPAVFGALVRFDAEGALIGAPALTATFAQDEWFSGCTDSLCLFAVFDAANADAPIARVIRIADTTPPACESQRSVNLRY